MAQKRLLEDLAGDAPPFDANGAGAGAQDMQLGAFGEAGAASETELRKIARYVESVAGITGRPDANLRDKVGDLHDACMNNGVARKEAEGRMYSDLWQCLHSMAEYTANQASRTAEQGDNL